MVKEDNGNPQTIRINELPVGVLAKVCELGNDSISLKLMEMGLIPGKLIQVVKKATYNDPIAIRYGDTTLGLRKSEAQKIWVTKIEE